MDHFKIIQENKVDSKYTDVGRYINSCNYKLLL